MHPVVVIGGGPGGLEAAHELLTRGVKPILLEKGSTVGGSSRTERYKGYFFDVGGDRFFTKNSSSVTGFVSFVGSLIGFVYGFILSTLGGALFSWIYDAIVHFRNGNR